MLDTTTLKPDNGIKIKPKRKVTTMKKIIVNSSWGGFCVPKGFELPEDAFPYDYPRDDVALVEYVETHPEECGDLRVVELPNDCTDWLVNDYDGMETVFYVVGGKIFRA